MGIYYYKLFDFLNRKGLKKGDLKKITGMSGTTIAKLSKNAIVQTDVINKVCAALDCQPADIMEYIPDEDDEPR